MVFKVYFLITVIAWKMERITIAGMDKILCDKRKKSPFGGEFAHPEIKYA
jgi:hypothetical protein